MTESVLVSTGGSKGAGGHGPLKWSSGSASAGEDVKSYSVTHCCTVRRTEKSFQDSLYIFWRALCRQIDNFEGSAIPRVRLIANGRRLCKAGQINTSTSSAFQRDVCGRSCCFQVELFFHMQEHTSVIDGQVRHPLLAISTGEDCGHAPQIPT